VVQSIRLEAPASPGSQQEMRRLNRMPILISIVMVALFLGVVIIGLSFRGFSFSRDSEPGGASGTPATNFGDQLKKGVADGIIGEPEKQEIFQPVPVVPRTEQKREPLIERRAARDERSPGFEPEEEWRARLQRDQEEQYLREVQRQRMARVQAQASALDSPLKVDLSDTPGSTGTTGVEPPGLARTNGGPELVSPPVSAGLLAQNADPNGQLKKESFFNQDSKELGYLPTKVISQLSPYELKRGSVIPATLITGLNSDLPGRISAQVSRDVYDSATGYRLLVPQGTKLFGRYDSKISFGQERLLVVWTDLVFPDGSTLQIGGMAGTDAEGYAGFKDKVDRHLLRTFGSAALVALIGTGIDRSLPESSTLATQDSASDAARRNFAESFGRVAEQSISRNLDVQPTIRIRPGYTFNILVDQDIVFPSAYRQR
jgi:type IV secretory pathway VirB10-like protein